MNGKYSSKIFEIVDSEFTEVNIQADETYALTSETISKNWWNLLFKTSGTTISTTFDGIQAIYPVKSSDISGTDAEIAERLYISESDCAEFKAFYHANQSKSTVYLFRYQVSDYMAQEATLFERGSFLGMTTWTEVDTNAYFFQETVNLDFDVIDVTFSNGEKAEVIPVVSNPIDVIPDATSPEYTKSDAKKDWLKWLKRLLALIFIAVILILLLPILPTVLKAVAWILLLPIRALRKLFRGKGDKDK